MTLLGEVVFGQLLQNLQRFDPRVCVWSDRDLQGDLVERRLRNLG
jgi:hypothetical protein